VLIRGGLVCRCRYPDRSVSPRLANRLVTPIVAAVIGALVVTDWPAGLTGRFWSRHPMLAGVVSGLVLLAIGYLLVENWIERSNARRWEVVRGIGFKSLGKAADDLGRGMDQLSGGDVIVLERKIRDRETCARLVDQLDELKQRHREQIARWAAVLMATRQLAAVLNACAELNDSVFLLQGSLRIVRDLPGSGPPGQHRVDVLRRWGQARMQCVLIQEQLMRAAVDECWQHDAGRAVLTPEWLAALDAAHADHPLPVPRAALPPALPDSFATGRA
jgi:hypothetical protein